MNAPEISRILGDWAHALEKDYVKKSHVPVRDLVNLYSKDDSSKESNDISSQRHVRPWSREDYISRLLSFKHPAAWFAKPTIISPLECARHGWCNGAINQLNCISCSAKLLHDESDTDGKEMLLKLQKGHSSNCGWTNNFCPEDFISFPMKSSESLCEEFLMRFRSLLLAVAEFSRESCITADGQRTVDAQSVLSSSSKVTNSNCMQLKVGEAVYKSVPKLSKWIFQSVSSSTIDDNENRSNTIEVPILPVSYPACRTRLAAAVEATDRQLLRYKGNNNSISSSGAQSMLSQLNGCIEVRGPRAAGGDVTTTPDADIATAERASQQVIKMCVLLAVSGWVPTSSTAKDKSKVSAHRETAADASASATTSSQESPTATALVSAPTSTLGADCLRCDWCGRSYPFKYLMAAKGDPLLQHRAFCQWGHYSGTEVLGDYTDKTPGWLKCAEAVIDCRGSVLLTQSDRPDGSSVGVSNRRLSSIIAESSQQLQPDSSTDSTSHKEEPLVDSAEQAYKKIKLVLDSATLPRLSVGGRRSI